MSHLVFSCRHCGLARVAFSCPCLQQVPLEDASVHVLLVGRLSAFTWGAAAQTWLYRDRCSAPLIRPVLVFAGESGAPPPPPASCAVCAAFKSSMKKKKKKGKLKGVASYVQVLRFRRHSLTSNVTPDVMNLSIDLDWIFFFSFSTFFNQQWQIFRFAIFSLF